MQQSIKIKAEDLELKKANADVLLPNRDLTQWNSVDETIIEKPKWQIGHGLQIAINQMEVSNRLSSMNSASRTPARSSSNSNLENPFSQFSKSPKRNSESQNDDSSGQKKSRVETEIDLPVPFETELIPNTIASPLNPNTPVYTTLSNIFDGSTTSTPRLSVDTSAYDYSTYLTEGADYIPSPHSPPVSPVRICNSEKVWQGFLSMPLVASLQCSCHQVSGKEITSLNIWSQIITSDIVVDGRIGQKEVDSYLNQISSHNSTSKHIIVVEFRSQHNDREQYTKIFNYFNDKDRYGVIKSPFPTVKDFYIIPVKQNTSLPRVLVDLVECKVNRPVENTLYGVIILHSQVLRRLNIETLDPRYSVMSQNPQQENGNGVLDGAQPSLSILLSNLTSGLQKKQTIANPALEALLKQVSNQNKI